MLLKHVCVYMYIFGGGGMELNSSVHSRCPLYQSSTFALKHNVVAPKVCRTSELQPPGVSFTAGTGWNA